jgi:hypothetical protein
MPAGTFLHAAGPVMAAVANLEATITGVGGHGALPHNGTDPLGAAAQIVAELGAGGAEALTTPREALAPSALGLEEGALVLAVTASMGEYRAGDLVWLRQIAPGDAQSAMNRDCLVPRPGGRFAFGRLIDRRGTLVGLLPPGAGQKQVVVDNPPWIALAFMLVRAL